MGLRDSLRTVYSWSEEAEASSPKWGRIVGVGRRVGPMMKIDLEIHYADEPLFTFSRYQLVPRHVRPEVGQDVAISRSSDTEATTYAIDWSRPPQYRRPYRGAVSEADRERVRRATGRSGHE
jgi:hypothetical protein